MNSFWFCRNWVLKKNIWIFILSWKKHSWEFLGKKFPVKFLKKCSNIFMKRILEHFLGWENSISKNVFFFLCFDTRKKCRKLILWKKKEFLEKRFMINCVNNFPLIKKNLKSYIYKKNPQKMSFMRKIFFFHMLSQIKRKKINFEWLSWQNDFSHQFSSITPEDRKHFRSDLENRWPEKETFIKCEWEICFCDSGDLIL